jgi:hypothetical protein
MNKIFSSLKQLLILFLVFGLFAVISNPVSALPFSDGDGPIPEPDAFVKIGEEEIDIPLPILDPETGNYILEPFSYEIPGVARINFQAFGKPDPFMNWIFGATNFAAGVLPFSFSFTTPIVLAPGPTIVTGSTSMSFTEGFQGGTVTVNPLAPPPNKPQDGPDMGPLPDEMVVYTVSPNGGVNFLSMGVDVGTAHTTGPLAPGGSIAGPAFNAGPQGGPVGPFNLMQVDVNFNLTGSGDSVTLNGAASINPAAIPEPSTILLLGAGVVFMGLMVLRRKRNSD